MGSVVEIGNFTFSITRELGRGAFGVVFEATARDALGVTTVAVKVSPINESDLTCSVQAQADQLLTECSVLQHLRGKFTSQSSLRVPMYLAHSVTPSHILLAMSK